MTSEIKQAAICRFNKKNKFLVHSLSRIKMGGSIATEPYIWLDTSSSMEEVTKQLLYALSCSKSDLPNPSSWDESLKEFLNAIGLKRNSDLYDKTVNVGVLQKNGVITFTPMQNLGSQGFVNVPNVKIEVEESKSNEEIATALYEVLNICQ